MQLRASLVLEFDLSILVSFETYSIIFFCCDIHSSIQIYCYKWQNPQIYSNLCSYAFLCYCFYFSTRAFGFKLLTFIVITEHGAQVHIIMATVLWLTWSKAPKTKHWNLKMLNPFLEICFPFTCYFRNLKLIVTVNVVSGNRIKTDSIL